MHSEPDKQGVEHWTGKARGEILTPIQIQHVVQIAQQISNTLDPELTNLLRQIFPLAQAGEEFEFDGTAAI